ncbi:MAG TPA: HEAT repeat domain-containing protein [Humisphaera sp.]
MNRPTLFIVVALLLAGLFASGCHGGGPGQKQTYSPGPPQGPPKMPEQELNPMVPVDAALVAAARQELSANLRHEKPFVAANAVEGLRYATDPEAEAAIVARHDDDAQAVRYAAAMVAGDLKLRSAMPRLVAHLDDRDRKVQVAVRYAMHKLGDFRHTAELADYLKDQHPQGWVTGATVVALGRLGERSAIPLLRQAAADPREAVRRQVNEALLLLGDQSGREVISGYLAGPDVMFGLLALAQAADPKLKLLAQQHLTYDVQEIALVAARAVAAMGGDDGYGVAMAGVKSTVPNERALAALAFGAIGRTDAQPMLAALLKDKDVNVRIAAATAVLQIAKEPKRYTRKGELIAGPQG